MSQIRSLFLALAIGGGCSASHADPAPPNPADASDPSNPDNPGDPDSTQPDQVTVQLAPHAGVTGMQRVNFAVPLVAGKLTDPAKIRVLAAGTEVASGRRVLAKY